MKCNVLINNNNTESSLQRRRARGVHGLQGWMLDWKVNMTRSDHETLLSPSSVVSSPAFVSQLNTTHLSTRLEDTQYKQVSFSFRYEKMNIFDE